MLDYQRTTLIAEKLKSIGEIIEFKPELKSHSFPPSCNQALKALLKINGATSFILEKTQLNLMYNIAQSVVAAQGTTKSVQIIIDNTRLMGNGYLMTGISRSKNHDNVALLHPPTSINDLKRDCKVNFQAVQVENYILNRIRERSSDIGFLKYIVNLEYFKY